MAPDTRAELLDTAQELVQTGGFNWFSYRDLADRVGIRTPSIHYHFPTKTDLGVARLPVWAGVVSQNRTTSPESISTTSTWSNCSAERSSAGPRPPRRTSNS